MSRIGARALLDAVLDDGSFRSWDSPPLEVAAGDEYRRELAAASAKTGLDESVLTGEGTVFARRVAIVACEFDYLAGSIGVAAAERITAAVARATAEGLPLLASPSSGGTRMQEGTVAFLQMVKIAAAVELHKQAHLPYLVYLRHPTTGGVFASWGSLGHVTAAEPGALVGFLGPRVYEHLYGEPFPPGIQTAENLQRHGVIDGVVPLEALRSTLDRTLKVVADPPGRPPPHPDPSRSPTYPPGSRWRHRVGETGRMWATCCGTARPNGCCCRGPVTVRLPPPCWRWPGSGDSRPCYSASSASWAGPVQSRVALPFGREVPPPSSLALLSGPPHCAKRAGAWRWRRACSCPWFSSSTRPDPR